MYSGNHILVEDFAGKINSYDLRGDYLSNTDSVIVSNKLFSITNVNDSTFLVSKELLGLYFHKDLTQPYYSVDLVNDKGKVLKKMVERDVTLPKIPVKSIQSQFYKFHDQIFLCPATENTIYHFAEKDSTLRSLYAIEIHNTNVNAAFEEQKHSAAPIFFRNIYSLSIAAITEKYFILNANRQKGESRYLLINRSNHQTTVYDRTRDEDMNFGRFVANDKGLPLNFPVAPPISQLSFCITAALVVFF